MNTATLPLNCCATITDTLSSRALLIATSFHMTDRLSSRLSDWEECDGVVVDCKMTQSYNISGCNCYEWWNQTILICRYHWNRWLGNYEYGLRKIFYGWNMYLPQNLPSSPIMCITHSIRRRARHLPFLAASQWTNESTLWTTDFFVQLQQRQCFVQVIHSTNQLGERFLCRQRTLLTK